MNIEKFVERFFVKGKRINAAPNENLIEGFLLPLTGNRMVIKSVWPNICGDYASYEIDPATLEPVSAGVVTKENGNIFCPHCDKRIGGMKGYDYCGYCGQRLDWDV